MRLFKAIQAFFRVLFNADYATRVERLALEDRSGEVPSLKVLMLFQREGRLVDFLKEEIDGFDDAQIGAAVRDIHRKCRKVLSDQVTVEPIRKEPQGTVVEVPEGFDAAQIRLIGNVKGAPPFKGVLVHHGWRVVEVRLPEIASDQDPRIVAPAEVEVR
ncbi:MAG: DUF2760 domain-containing protein [Candidatus Riflebacteria bacterium]|nr:DUF2760 domain-containing protein [Candidatus Riflebacteria bacterium]